MRNRFALGVPLAIALLLGALAEPADAGPPKRDYVVGGGYAAFVTGGSPGENSYWVFARERPNGQPTGEWYADVVIEFPGFTWVFQALYTVDCLGPSDQVCARRVAPVRARSKADAAGHGGSMVKASNAAAGAHRSNPPGRVCGAVPRRCASWPWNHHALRCAPGGPAPQPPARRAQT